MNHTAESQLTLVDPSIAAAADGHIILSFDMDDMKNTVLRLRNDPRPRYLVHTVNNAKTTVHGGDQLLATIERKTLRPDQITFPGASPMNLGDWLKAPMWSSFPLSFEEGGKRFQWRENFVGQLSLHDPTHSETMAWFSKSRKRLENGKLVVHAAFIAIKPEYDHMRDAIVTSCLLAEHKLRMKGKHSALSEGAASMSLMAYSAVQ
ncbi:hypothetical protein JVT61DRAFT_2577 [Boletus reticuloceps]|uniref:DUF6593 domain-containing protein n=1 Tax=Boletus reticuloceps TaxID=495285 RepID=A0A8I2YPG7_9AGAM|nr:hypothetical protein JVT61DRAFT_2577 [Boletus reticuloceps]